MASKLSFLQCRTRAQTRGRSGRLGGYHLAVIPRRSRRGMGAFLPRLQGRYCVRVRAATASHHVTSSSGPRSEKTSTARLTPGTPRTHASAIRERPVRSATRSSILLSASARQWSASLATAPGEPIQVEQLAGRAMRLRLASRRVTAACSWPEPRLSPTSPVKAILRAPFRATIGREPATRRGKCDASGLRAQSMMGRAEQGRPPGEAWVRAGWLAGRGSRPLDLHPKTPRHTAERPAEGFDGG